MLGEVFALEAIGPPFPGLFAARRNPSSTGKSRMMVRSGVNPFSVSRSRALITGCGTPPLAP